MSADRINQMLSVLCPMHIVFGCDGLIRSAGPTALKLAPAGLVGARLLDLLEIKRPREITTMEALREQIGVRLNLRFKARSETQLQGVVMPGPASDEMIVNLSFGISIVDAVRDFDLTAADFAPTDLAVEMLYLVEAKSAAMDASRKLNKRLQTAREEAEEQALTDTLTGLRNRRGLDHALNAAIDMHESFALMHVDLDFFKAVNDSYGHAAGDYVLTEVARIMNDETRGNDIVARVGGDEFVILIRGSADPVLIDAIAKRIIRRLEDPFTFDGKTCQISGSVGSVVAAEYTHPTAERMLGDADAALYAAKKAGRGQHISFAPHMRKHTQIA